MLYLIPTTLMRCAVVPDGIVLVPVADVRSPILISVAAAVVAPVPPCDKESGVVRPAKLVMSELAPFSALSVFRLLKFASI